MLPVAVGSFPVCQQYRQGWVSSPCVWQGTFLSLFVSCARPKCTLVCGDVRVLVRALHGPGSVLME